MKLAGAFAFFWILFNGYNLYNSLIKKNSEEERNDIHNELLEMCRMMSPSAVGKTMMILFACVFAFDCIGFYLTYTYAYAAANHFYVRIILFIAFIVVFSVEQIMSFRQTIKISVALKIPNIKDDVLKRFMRMTERDMDFINTIASVAKFVAALQLVLYTILSTAD
ncbi:MAG: hypothetical protein K6C05_03815 [Anaerovibrio sp.]|uniref:hypothetical protein n=1 Tax=Anaerovibrio sp. TaxID=1872532 RepID=UPI0025F58217|nr:hypothetical protein [Anaerovibrio sp.]MCR5175958.1 hypothetical protein [Anaerovibrio sp.]